MNPDKTTIRTEERIYDIEVSPGWKNGSKIVFENDGNEAAGYTSGDVVFFVKELDHARFTRSGDDLLFVARVSLSEALTGVRADVVRIVPKL